MPIDPIIIDTTIQAYGIVGPTYGNILIIGREAGGSAADDTVVQCNNLAEVATQFGSTSDIYYAAENIFGQGIFQVWAIRVSQTAIVAESVTEGSVDVLANYPVSGLPAPTLGSGDVIVYTFGVPTDPGAGFGMLNPKTGQIWVNGAGTDAINYSYMDFTAIEAVLQDENIDIVCVAKAEGDAQFWGEVDEFLDMCDTHKWILPIKSDPTAAAADIVTDFGNYSSRNMVAVASKALGANEDLNAAVAGMIAMVEPWDKLMWKVVQDITPSAYFTKSEVENTLEVGNVNAIIDKQAADRLSDGLTTAGGDYKYVDTTRTQYWLEETIINDLSLLVQNNLLPYTQTGVAEVQSTIEKTCENAVSVGALRAPWVDGNGVGQTGYVVQVPQFNDIPDSDRVNRILQNVYVTVYFAGHIQSITLNLAIQL